VTNVDDEGNELGSGTMELTQTELVLHTRKRDAVRWPYLCLRRYGYDSNLFSFESGRRCQTGQGIFAFKCPRAEEIFTLLQELMQCNSINVVEEPVMMGRPGHPPELDIPRTPQTPNTYTVQGFPNGYPGYPISADSSHASSRHPSLADDDQTHTYVNTASVEGEVRGRHCVHSLPEVRPSTFAETTRSLPPVGGQGGSHPGMHCCPHEEHGDPQVFLQTTSQEAKFRLGPTPAQRRMLDRERHAHHSHGLRGHEEGAVASEMEGSGPQSLPPFHLHNPHSYHHHHHHLAHRHPVPEPQEVCQATQLTYENINGLRGSARRRGRRLNPCPGSRDEEDDDDEEGGQDEDDEYEEEDYDEYEFSEGP
ncbi:hypothetical protein Z043_125466, partial [Scleropages formosus]